MIVVQCFWKLNKDDGTTFPIAIVKDKETYFSILDKLINERKECLINQVKMIMGNNYPLKKDEILVVKCYDGDVEISYKLSFDYNSSHSLLR